MQKKYHSSSATRMCIYNAVINKKKFIVEILIDANWVVPREAIYAALVNDSLDIAKLLLTVEISYYPIGARSATESIHKHVTDIEIIDLLVKNKMYVSLGNYMKLNNLMLQ